MNISGILVVARPGGLTHTLEELGRIEGVEVHHMDRSTGRIVVTVEAPTIDGEIDVLKRIQSLPAVVLAEMVEHHVDVDADGHDPGEPD